MERDQLAGGHRNATPEADHHNTDTEQSDGVIYQDQHKAYELSRVPVVVPILSSQNQDTYIPLGKLSNTSPALLGTTMAALAPTENTPGEYDEEPFPDLMEQQFQDEHAPTWPLSQASDGSYGASQQYPTESVTDSEDHNIQAFAKLEFDDGEFYMNTYAVELGRDIQAAREAEEREAEVAGGSDSKSKKRSSSRGGSVRSERAGKENGQNSVDGIVSESGGIIVDNQPTEGSKKLKRKKPKSWSSSSRPLSRTSSMHFQGPKIDYNALAMASLMDSSPGHSRYEVGRPMPSPDLTPLIPIHPSPLLEGFTSSHKSISRKHIRIAFNFDKHLFQIEILGRNGGFVDDEWYAQGEIIPLVNGSIIQVGGVGVRFVLPDVPPGETGAEMGMGSDPLSGGMESFDMADSSREASEEEAFKTEDADNTSKIKQEKGKERGTARTREKGNKKTEVPTPALPKRKGPGRPPKNGIISKREQAQLARQAKEETKAKAEGRPIAPPESGKSKNGSVPKGAKVEESNVQPNGKRKYTKRKRAGGTEDQQAVRESTEHTESVPPEQGNAATVPPKPAKEKRPPKPPRSPSPVFDESQMTPEQLAKPQSSYVVLIHEALTNSKTGQMSLPQIYRAIERRYPFYKLRVQTQGWQSSVRHNLSQHPAFRKIERDGKGWMWGLVPEISIEKEKKRRATPPPATQQHYYAPNPMMQHTYQYPAMPQPNGNMPPIPYGTYPGTQPGPMPYPPPARAAFQLPIVNAVQSESTYRSPYQSTPPPGPAQSTPQSQQPLDTNGINGYYPTPVSQPQAQNSSGNPNMAGPHTSPSPHPSLMQNSNGNQNPTSTNTLPSPQIPAAPESSTKGNNNSRSQSVNLAVTKFKTTLINTLDDKSHGETLVTSAINRVLGIQTKSSLPGEEDDPNERTIMDTVSKMLWDLSDKYGAVNDVPIPEVNGEGKDGSTGIAVAAENAARIALGRMGPSAANEQTGAQEQSNRTHGPLENGIGTKTNDSGQPETK